MTTPTPKPGDRDIPAEIEPRVHDALARNPLVAALFAPTPAPDHEYVEAEDEQRRPCGYCGICGQPEGLCASTAPTPAAGTRCCIGPFADGRHALNCPERCQDCGGDPDGPAACLARLRDLYETEQRLRRKADSELVKLKNLTGLDPAKWVPDEIPAAGGSDTELREGDQVCEKLVRTMEERDEVREENKRLAAQVDGLNLSMDVGAGRLNSARAERDEAREELGKLRSKTGGAS